MPAAAAQGLGSIPCLVSHLKGLLSTSHVEVVSPDEDAVAAVEDAPAGTVFCFEPGIHRLRESLVPQDGDAFVGVPGAILNGSEVIDSFSVTGNHWVSRGHTQEWEPAGRCLDAEYRGCLYREDVFLDDVPLWQVMDRGALAPGRFYFDYARDRIYLADDPDGHMVEVTVAMQAIGAEYLQPAAPDVIVSGLVIEKFASAYQNGAIHSGVNWLIENNEVRLNHGIGICGNEGSWVRDNYVHHNGEMGLCGQGAGIRVTGNEISFNNTQGFDWYECGGAKWVNTTGLLVEDNYSHDNIGPGLWTDIDNVDSTYANNVVSDNAGPGIMHEISYATNIVGNQITGNGFGQWDWVPTGILIVGSRDVLIEGNIIHDNNGGVGLAQDDRVRGIFGRRALQNVTVRENEIQFTTGKNGYWSYRQARPRWEPKGLHFLNNDYMIPRKTSFRWVDRTLDPRSWRSLGFDTGSSFGLKI